MPDAELLWPASLLPHILDGRYERGERARAPANLSVRPYGVLLPHELARLRGKSFLVVSVGVPLPVRLADKIPRMYVKPVLVVDVDVPLPVRLVGKNSSAAR